MPNSILNERHVKRNDFDLWRFHVAEQTRHILHKRIGAAALLAFAVLISAAVWLNSMNFFVVEIDGRLHSFVSMSSDTRAVLHENGYDVGEHDLLSGDMTAIRGFANVTLEQRFPVTVFAGGVQSEIYSSKGETVLSALTGAGIQLRALDKVYPSVMQPTESNMLIEVVEISLQYNAFSESEVLSLKEKAEADRLRLEAEEKAKREADNKAKADAYAKAKNNMMAKDAAAALLYNPGANLLPLEQEGNVLVTREGTFKYITKFDGVCTAYCSGTHTATGTPVRVGSVAVDPKVIPLKSKLYIVARDGTSWMYGYAVAEDTGGAVKGNIVDLYIPDYTACINFGRRKATIYILE